MSIFIPKLANNLPIWEISTFGETFLNWKKIHFLKRNKTEFPIIRIFILKSTDNWLIWEKCSVWRGSFSEKITEFSRYFLTIFFHTGKNSEKISWFFSKIFHFLSKKFSQKIAKSNFFLKSADYRKKATFYNFWEISEKMTEFSQYFFTSFSHTGKNSEKISWYMYGIFDALHYFLYTLGKIPRIYCQIS